MLGINGSQLIGGERDNDGGDKLEKEINDSCEPQMPDSLSAFDKGFSGE